MAQFPVLGYILEISTAPRPRQPGVPAPEMIPAVFIQLGGANQQYFQLPVNSTDEFMAICALFQTPGRLVFDPDQQKVQKVAP
jgi:hypothetical protein